LNIIKRGWIVRIHRIDEHDLEFHLPVFVFVFTKLKVQLAPSEPFIELKIDLQKSNDKFVRADSIVDAKNKIKEYQNYGITKYHIANKKIDSQDDVFFHLYDSVKNSKYPRFTIYIIDSDIKARTNGIFAVFVVPIGKEIEWLFSTKNGREELVAQAKYQRLAVVHLSRHHSYGDLNTIIEELSPKVNELAPKGLPSNYKIPLLSMGPDVDVRDVKFKGSSEMSGDFFVEDVTSDDLPTRRLIFQSINTTIQTEVVLKKGIFTF
jgi:hypothetical protein